MSNYSISCCSRSLMITCSYLEKLRNIIALTWFVCLS